MKWPKGPASMQMQLATKFRSQPCGSMWNRSHLMKPGWSAPGIEARGGEKRLSHGTLWKRVCRQTAFFDTSSNGILSLVFAKHQGHSEFLKCPRSHWYALVCHGWSPANPKKTRKNIHVQLKSPPGRLRALKWNTLSASCQPQGFQQKHPH